MKRSDRIASIILIGICTYFWIKAKSFSKFGAFFPKVVIIVLGILSLLLLVQSFIKKEDIKIFRETSTKYITIIISSLLIIIWGFFINVLGFVFTSILFFTIIYIILDRKKRGFSAILIKIVTVILIVGLFYIFFEKILLVPFPKGILF